MSQPELDGAEADLDRVSEQIRTMKDNIRQRRTVKADIEGFSRR